MARVMNITNGDEVSRAFDSDKEAQEWIDGQTRPESFMIINTY